MANVSIKISQLKPIASSSITNDDFLPIVDSGSLRTYRITLGDIITKASQNVALLSGSDQQILYANGNIIYGDDSLKFNYVSKSLQHGLSSSAFGLYSHAEGYKTFITGVYAHAEGYETYAYGTASHAAGYQTYAYGDYQSVIGQFNINSPENTSSLFIIGGGIDNSNRADILLVDRSGLTVNGDINFSGSLYKNNLIYVPASASYALSASYAVNGGTGGSSQWTDIAGGINYTGGTVSVNQITPQYSLDVNGNIGNSQTSDYLINTASNNSYFNANGGNVGIGTLVPAYKLDVSGDIGLTGNLRNGNGGDPQYSNFLGSGAGNAATYADNSNFIGYQAGYNATNANYSNFFGHDAGSNATNADNSNFQGYKAGNNATDANNSNFLGNYAGNNATNANSSNFFGTNAGNGATNAYTSNFIGLNAGQNATNAYFSNFFGAGAGIDATNANYSNFFGIDAGNGATSANHSNFLGVSAGAAATNAYNSNFLGEYAGNGATSANHSNFLGVSAGNYAYNAYNSNFLGSGAGFNAYAANDSNFFGNNAGWNANYAANSNFFGYQAGYNAQSAANSVFIGYKAGYGATTAINSIFIGYNAGSGSTLPFNVNRSSILIGNYTKTLYNDSIAIGKGTANSTNNQFNIGNVLFGLNIYSGSTPTSTPQTNGRVGIGKNNPSYTLDVSGSGNFTGGIIISASLSTVPSNVSGSMFYSASALWVFTGTSNDYGAGVGWSTASLSI